MMFPSSYIDSIKMQSDMNFTPLSCAPPDIRKERTWCGKHISEDHCVCVTVQRWHTDRHKMAGPLGRLKRLPTFTVSRGELQFSLRTVDPTLRLSLTRLVEASSSASPALPDSSSPGAEARFAASWDARFRHEWARLRTAVHEIFHFKVRVTACIAAGIVITRPSLLAGTQGWRDLALQRICRRETQRSDNLFKSDRIFWGKLWKKRAVLALLLLLLLLMLLLLLAASVV
jgi:hypothetical protein